MVASGIRHIDTTETHASAGFVAPAFSSVLSRTPDATVPRLSEADAMGAALAHELNQPLAALSIYLQSLQKMCKKLDSEHATLINELVEKSLRETARTSDIVRRMRRLTLRNEPERQDVDINSIADESIEVALIGISKKPAITRNLAPDLPTVSGDPNQIRQVLINLLRNAIEASGDQSDARIGITTRMTSGMVHFIISDNGPGIDPKIVNRLFRAFETSKPQGLGLGLAISRMIAQNHGGDLVLEAEGNNAGTCFALRLPLN